MSRTPRKRRKTRRTVESHKKTKNSVMRVLFCLLAILAEVAVILLTVSRLNKAAPFLDAVATVAALVLVLFIYSRDTTSAVKMPWIILILTVPVFGLVLYILVGQNSGTKRMRARYKAIGDVLFPPFDLVPDLVPEAAAACPRAGSIAAYIRRESHYPVYKNTDVTYYDDAAKGLEAQLDAMKRAERYIFMEYHAIEDAETWQRIETVLAERVRHGVEVRVFYDDMGSIGFISPDFVRKLEKKGIACRIFNPFMPGLNLFLNNRDHRKITVVDGKVGFTGGYNLANEYFNLTHPYGSWKDTGIRIEGDAVGSLTAAFLEMWNAIKGTDRRSFATVEKYFPPVPYEAKETGWVQPYAIGPMDRERIGENVYISIAEKAERYCWFTTPYLIITDEMNHALQLAAKRGTDVRIVTPGIPDKKLIYRVTRSFYHDLAAAGVRIYEWTPGFLHAKMCVADDVMATCGTLNLDYRSLYHHFENGCFLIGCEAVGAIKADFERTFAECREVTEQYADDPATKDNIIDMFLRLFAELM